MPIWKALSIYELRKKLLDALFEYNRQERFRNNALMLKQAFKQRPKVQQSTESPYAIVTLGLGTRTEYTIVFRQLSLTYSETEITLYKPLSPFKSDDEKGIWFQYHDGIWYPAHVECYESPPWRYPDWRDDIGWGALVDDDSFDDED